MSQPEFTGSQSRDCAPSDCFSRWHHVKSSRNHETTQTKRGLIACTHTMDYNPGISFCSNNAKCITLPWPHSKNKSLDHDKLPTYQEVALWLHQSHPCQSCLRQGEETSPLTGLRRCLVDLVPRLSPLFFQEARRSRHPIWNSRLHPTPAGRFPKKGGSRPVLLGSFHKQLNAWNKRLVLQNKATRWLPPCQRFFA